MNKQMAGGSTIVRNMLYLLGLFALNLAFAPLAQAQTAPSITSLSPGGGQVGTSVTITGANFGSSQGTSTINFNGVAAAARGRLATSWSSTSIVVNVPSGATSGNVVVTVGSQASNAVFFTVGTFISNLSPANGAVGTQVSISGSSFGATQGTSTVTFNGTAATPSNWSNSSIVVPVPSGVTTGNVVVTVSGMASNGMLFTAAPVINSLSATTLATGAPLTITGLNFGANQGTGTVTFNGTSAQPSSWSNTSIVVPVPIGATPGNVVVTTNGMSSNGVSFTPGTFISALSSSTAAVGTAITITGGNFGASQGNSTVTFNGLAATPGSWSSSQIVVPVPLGSTPGNVVVTVNGLASNPVGFTPGPSLTSMTPVTAVTGTTVTINGVNFGSAQGTSTVTFNGAPATSISQWNNTQIVAVAPSAATTGNVVVTIAGNVSNGVVFTVLPNITNISSASGIVGSSITISGSGFGTTQGTSMLTFNGVSATPVSWSTTQIVAPVPSAATTGSVVVSVSGNSSNGMGFTVTPGISSVSPAYGPIGAVVTISGTTFGATQGPSTVSLNGSLAAVSSWSNTQIIVTVPSAATTGNLVVTVNGNGSNLVSFPVTPAITGVSPVSGVAGTSVTVTGTSFGAAQGTSTITFNGTSGAPSSWTNTTIVVPVPAGATNGNIVVTVGGYASNGVNFVVAPVLTSLSPTSGTGGTLVTISGTNFGSTQTSSTVTFNGAAATPVSWSNNTIVTPVPGGASSGNVVVTVAGSPSNALPFNVKPTYSFHVTYAPNGNVLSSQDNVNGNWTYTYDDFNRLSTAVSLNGSGCIESYDRFGNRWSQQPYGNGNTCAGSSLSFTGNNTTNNNRIDGYSYDAAGNLLSDGSHSFLYDAEGRIISVDNGQTATYIYDADGQRIRKVTSAGTVDYLYDMENHVITEVSGTGAWNRGEIYAEGRHVATYNNGTTYFNQDDWLGTERARSTLRGAQCETMTSLPYGDGLTISGTCGDPSPNHFTGKQRDTEDNLDYFGARYYSSATARFMIPDWSARPATVPYANFGDPQSLNLYLYVRNDPVSRIDADGHTDGDATDPALDKLRQAERECGAQNCFVTKDEKNETATLTRTTTETKITTDQNGDHISTTTRVTTSITVSTADANNGQVLGGTKTTEVTSSNLNHLSEGAKTSRTRENLNALQAIDAIGSGKLVAGLQKFAAPSIWHRLNDHKIGVGGILVLTAVGICAIAEPCGLVVGSGTLIGGTIVGGGAGIYDLATH